jgi:hypothetical protein
MRAHHILSILALAAVTGSPASAGQRWGRENFPRDGACFFRDVNFRGEYFCVRAGDSIERMPGDMNDQITSIRVFGRAEVIVYKDNRFEGRSHRYDGDVRNVGDAWNDEISSIEVRVPGRGAGRPGNFPGGGGGGGFFGRSQDPDRIVRRAYEDVLGREPDQDGLRTYRSRIIDDGWTEAQVREALRNSSEYRERSTMTPARAQEIVRRAYLAVLNREPDGGARVYIDRVLRDKWTQGDVERELRNSAEYRNRRR